jgi:hypothetical protein
VGYSWEAASCAATQKFPNILWNAKVHDRTHKIPPLVPILSRINSVPQTLSYFSEIHLNNIFPPASISSYWSLSFWLSQQNSICIPLHPIRATCLAYVVLFDLIVLIVFGEEYRTSSLCRFLKPPTTSSLRSKYSRQHPYLKHPQSLLLP